MTLIKEGLRETIFITLIVDKYKICIASFYKMIIQGFWAIIFLLNIYLKARIK